MTSNCLYGSPSCNCGPIKVQSARLGRAKRVATVGLLTLIAWAFMVMALVGGLTTYDRAVNPAEDSGDLLLNCYIYGEGDCGPNGPWHGFVNLF